MCVDPGEAEKTVSSPALVRHTLSFPAPPNSQPCTRSPPPPWSWSVGARRGLGAGAGGQATTGLGDIWGLRINNTSSGSGGSEAAPGKERAPRAGLSAICQGTGAEDRGQGSCIVNSKGKQGEEFHTTGQGTRWGAGRVMRGLCVERAVRGRKSTGRTSGEVTDLWSQGAGTAVVGGASGVKGRGRGT